MKKKNFVLLFTLVVSFALLLTACGDENETNTTEATQATEVTETTEVKEEETEKAHEEKASEEFNSELDEVTIGYGNHLGCALYFIAEEEGLFGEYGVNVNLEVLPSGAEGAAAVQTGKLDAATMGSTQAFSLISQGQDLVIYGGQMHEGSGIITLPENTEEMSDFSNYKGKTIGLVRMSTGDVIFRGGLNEAGLVLGEDVEVIELDSAATVTEAVKKGEIDAGGSWIPHLANAESQGLEIAMYSGEVVPNHPCAIMVGMRDHLEANPNTFKKIHKALIRAFDIFEHNHEKAVEHIQKYLDLDTEVLMKDAYGRYSPNPEINVEAVNRFWELINEIDYVESDLDINNNINESFYNDALKEIIEEYPDNDFYKELEKGGYGGHEA